MQNTDKELQQLEENLHNYFLQGATQRGLLVVDYSGSDESVSLKRDIILVVERTTNKQGKTMQRLLFSTDVTMDPIELLEYYHCRFQMEFNFRDAKQSTGLTHSQARDLDKLYLYSFTTLLMTLYLLRME